MYVLPSSQNLSNKFLITRYMKQVLNILLDEFGIIKKLSRELSKLKMMGAVRYNRSFTNIQYYFKLLTTYTDTYA